LDGSDVFAARSEMGVPPHAVLLRGLKAMSLLPVIE
jgi:hypothetical protein